MPPLSPLVMCSAKRWFAASLLALIPSGGMAYPGAPSTWGVWTQRSYLGIYPRQMDAAADPDGRLRLLLVDANRGRTIGGRLYYRPLMASFRWQDSANAVLEAVQARNGKSLDAPYTQYQSDTVTPAAMNLPRRTQVATADRSGKNIAVSALFYSRTNQAEDSGAVGTTVTIGEAPAVFPYFPRQPWGGNGSSSLGGFNSNSNAGAVSLTGNGRAEVDCQIGGGFVQGAYFSMSVTPVSGSTGNVIAQVPPLPWGTSREITGLDVALTPDNKDVYFALCTAKPNGSQVSPEIRVYRHQSAPASPSSYSQGTSQWTDTATRTGTVAEGSWLYPKILLTKAGEPRWVLWSDPYLGLIKLARRVPAIPDADPATEEDRRIGSYNVLPPISGEPAANPYFALGRGPDAAMDALDRLHVVWHDQGSGDRQVHYARETASGSFEQITLPVRCSQPPTLAIGPGNYPYIAYAGPAAENGYLLITAPPGLLSSYHGDFEDRDGDGKPALMEFAQGSSDTSVESGLTLRNLGFFPTVATLGTGGRRFEMTFQLNANAVRSGTYPTWNLPDGADTIQIGPAYSNQLDGFYQGGFAVADEFSISGRGRVATVYDTFLLGPNLTVQFYHLEARRLPGPP